MKNQTHVRGEKLTHTNLTSPMVALFEANGYKINQDGRLLFWNHELANRAPVGDEEVYPPIHLGDIVAIFHGVSQFPSAFIQEYLFALFAIGVEVNEYQRLRDEAEAAGNLPRCIGQIQESQEGGRTRYKVMHNSSVLDANDGQCPKCGSAGNRSRFAVRVRTSDPTDLKTFPVDNRSQTAYEIHIKNQEAYETAVRAMENQRRRLTFLEMDIKRTLGACIDHRGNHPHWSLISWG